jgi:hypothetical protein
MSYEPSHRKPPRQERWPDATPGEGWPAYQQGDGGRTWESATALAGTQNGYGGASNGYGDASNSYGDVWGARGTTSGGYGDAWGGQSDARYRDTGYGDAGYGYGGATTAYPAAGDGYAGDGYTGDRYAGDGYADGFDGGTGGYADAGGGYTEDYAQAQYGHDGWDGYAQPGHEFAGSAGYLAQDEYPELDPAASSVLVAPDTMGDWCRADRSHDADRDPGPRGPVVGAVTGFLAAAAAIGVATFAAAFIRPQASPVSAVGGIFFDRTPAALRSTVMAHFGAHGKTMLLLGAIGLLALVLGYLARRNPSAGVAVIAAFGLLGAFVVITRPESRASDVIPSAIGALAGIVALLWLARASAPEASLRPAYGDGRRRTR